MFISEGLGMLKLSADILGKPSVNYPTLIWDEKDVILVDAGNPGQSDQIREGMRECGVPYERLNKIIITHHDLDHIGSLSEIREASPRTIEVLAHGDEKPYLEKEKVPIKLAQMEARGDSLPEPMKVLNGKMKAAFGRINISGVQTLNDGQELPCCGGVTVIHTPGHTPGHICLYLKRSKTLLTGDALMVEEGMLQIPQAFANYDDSAARKSIQKLAGFDIEKVICYHGGFYNDNSNRRIKELANL